MWGIPYLQVPKKSISQHEGSRSTTLPLIGTVSGLPAKSNFVRLQK